MPSTTQPARNSGATVGAPVAPVKHRLTVRARLALTYAGLVTVAGVVLLTIVSIFIGVIPSYEFATTAIAPGGIAAPASPLGIAVPESSVGGPAEMLYDPGLLSTTGTLSAVVTVSSRGDILHLLLWVSAGALVLLAAGGAWAGWFVAGRMLRPLQFVNAAARQASRGQLDHRIAFAGPRDEISELADNFDEMLTEIERSVDSHRRFSANASHELRTPLATTRAMLDVALSPSNPLSSEQRALLGRLRETNERSIDTVESLLDLTEIESVASHVEAVDLAHLAVSVIAETQAEAERAGVLLLPQLAPAVVEGDPVLLRQLVANLLQNAIRHNDRGGTVILDTSTSDHGVVRITVANDGDLIAADAVARLADPFFRGRGRTSAAADRGRGLGLSIVAAIVARHSAVLELTARPAGGLVAEVSFDPSSS
ncbi:sensor histidine kinase [Leifsonia sp. YAF41]|uniref:sensor histidine kinase n=1 Tax=Leifsonia sp. YAF41 TaxID=3233086 RepID=UPI003F98E4AF